MHVCTYYSSTAFSSFVRKLVSRSPVSSVAWWETPKQAVNDTTKPQMWPHVLFARIHFPISGTSERDTFMNFYLSNKLYSITYWNICKIWETIQDLIRTERYISRSMKYKSKLNRYKRVRKVIFCECKRTRKPIYHKNSMRLSNVAFHRKWHKDIQYQKWHQHVIC